MSFNEFMLIELVAIIVIATMIIIFTKGGD